MFFDSRVEFITKVEFAIIIEFVLGNELFKRWKLMTDNAIYGGNEICNIQWNLWQGWGILQRWNLQHGWRFCNKGKTCDKG
jgi:hypothetical protein